LGEVFYIEEDFWPLNTTLYVQDFKGNDPRFISYFLRSLDLARYNAAGAVPGINQYCPDIALV
jgi:type I restriction enzyme S subunit